MQAGQIFNPRPQRLKDNLAVVKEPRDNQGHGRCPNVKLKNATSINLPKLFGSRRNCIPLFGYVHESAAGGKLWISQHSIEASSSFLIRTGPVPLLGRLVDQERGQLPFTVEGMGKRGWRKGLFGPSSPVSSPRYLTLRVPLSTPVMVSIKIND